MRRSLVFCQGLAALMLLGALALACAQKAAVKTPATQAPVSATQASEAAASPTEAQHALIARESDPTIDRTLAKMRAACDWQLDHLYMKRSKKASQLKINADTDWVRGAFFSGVMGNYHATGDTRYYLAALNLAKSNKWKPGPRPRHADDRTIAQTYLELYLLQGKKDARQIQPIKDKFDAMMASEQPGRVDWWWCDALYMDPPTLARLATATGEKKYLDYMNRMYWDCHAFLFDKQEHLFYRDKGYMPQADGKQKLEKNGRKIFWSRGNGWVFGGLCRVMDFMPQDYPDRPKYEALFKEMAGAILAAQGKDGLWHASLLDPESYPLGETSGSGFFTYGLAWGINHGLLDADRFQPAVMKGFKALMACVDQDGKLCYVQPIGANPARIKPSDNMEYGTGAFLLAGGEVLKLLAGKPAVRTAIAVKNPLNLDRPSEMVEIPWKKLDKKAAGLLPSRIRLLDPADKDVVTQVIYGPSGPRSLIFQSDFKPGESKTFTLTLSDEPIRSVPESKTFGRYVPERLDDFAWENDRIAHRIYGTALGAPNSPDFLISSGIDVWCKKVRYPIINKWYAGKNYHKDSGEGCDNYKVDNSRGCGGIGIWAEKQLYCSGNYDKDGWRVLANGPLRTTFEVSYKPWDAAGRQFTEVKRITLDAGSNMSLIQSFFTSDKPGPVKVGIGLAKTRGEGVLVEDKKNGILSYWEDPAPKGLGSIATAVVVNPAQIVDYDTMDVPKSVQNLVLLKAGLDRPVEYYAGAGWSKSGDFADAGAWNKYVEDFVRRHRAPLKVSLK